MKRLLLFVVLAVLALPASAHASTFAAEFGSPFPTRPTTFGITVNDFNGDGLVDVAAVNGEQFDQTSNNVSIYLRQPTGGFVEEIGSPVAATFGANYVVSGDFGGDARPDLAVVAFGGGAERCSVLVRNSTNDGFTPRATTSSPTAGVRSRPLTSTVTAISTSSMATGTSRRCMC